jgi:hypothetical protein
MKKSDLLFTLIVLFYVVGFIKIFAMTMIFEFSIVGIIVAMIVYCAIFIPLLIAMRKYVFY